MSEAKSANGSFGACVGGVGVVDCSKIPKASSVMAGAGGSVGAAKSPKPSSVSGAVSGAMGVGLERAKVIPRRLRHGCRDGSRRHLEHVHLEGFVLDRRTKQVVDRRLGRSGNRLHWFLNRLHSFLNRLHWFLNRLHWFLNRGLLNRRLRN